MRNSLNLNLKLKQSLKLTPQMIQSINLLHLSNLDLLSHVEKELSENPLLEADRESSVLDSQYNEYLNDTESPGYEWVEYMEDSSDMGLSGTSKENEDAKRSFIEGAIASDGVSLHEHIMRQLRIALDKDEDIEDGEKLCAYINEDGYISEDLKTISQECGVEYAKLEYLLNLIKTFEPEGVGSKDVSEALSIQLRNMNPVNELAVTLVEKHLKQLSVKNYDKIAKELMVNKEEIKRAVSVIASCEPYPGRQFDHSKIRYVAPDVKVEKVNGEWKVILADDYLPKLTVSKKYSSFMKKGNDNEVNKYLSSKMNSAVMLIQAIEQRRRTLYKVASALLELQYEFFEYGKEKLKPLILKDVATFIDMSESTVSRISNNKYLLTVWGTFPIKYFFSGSVNSSDGNASKQSVKEIMKKIIEEAHETGEKLSDEKIREKLDSRGIKIARRTVAKYRKELKILSSRDR